MKRLSDDPAVRLAECRGEPVPPAGEVEVLAWKFDSTGEISTVTDRWDVAKHVPYPRRELVDRAHVTRLTAENARLQVDLASANSDKGAYGQNAIDLRKQCGALKAEVERLKNIDHRQILAESAAKYLLDSGAENFVGEVFTIEADDGIAKFEVVVTTQKVGAKSPGEVCNELQSELTKAREAMKEFCERVENGEVRSKRTYAKFKSLLANQSAPAAKAGE